MQTQESAGDIPLYRNLLAIAGGIYFLWWFAVEQLLEKSFNPLGSRLAVAGFFFAVWAASFLSERGRRHIQILYHAGLWLLSAHFFYLFYGNAGDNNWIIGSFITVLALAYCFFSLPPLLAYSAFVALLSAAMLFFLPGLQHSVFFPGIATILLQANISLATRLKVLKRLTESNERFQLLFHSTSEGVLLHEDKKIIDANEAMARMSGYRRDELIGKDILELLPPEERTAAAERIRTADASASETKILRKDGGLLPIESRAKDILFEEKILRLVTAHDLTERRKIEEGRIRAQAMQESLRAHDEFISLASHELKTPLTSLKLWTQILGRDLDKVGVSVARRAQEVTTLVEKQINRLSALVETMLDVSQVSSGALRLNRKPLDLTALAKEVIETLRPQSEASGSSINLDAPEPLQFNGDAARLMQLLENLLTNALKYGGAKPISVQISGDARNAVIRVQDRGVGISPEHMDRIFERFERLGSSINISGLGLGLFLVKQIVSAHGGTITVESKLQQGSVFTVTLPL